MVFPRSVPAGSAAGKLTTSFAVSIRRSKGLRIPYTVASLQQRRGLQLSSGTGEFDPRVFHVSEEVQDAIRTNKPVVALETTIYTHGFPHPENIALASRLEEIVRLNGGVPATIGILRGRAIVGLSPDEIVDLASSAGKEDTAKISRRDLPYYTGLSLAGRKFNGGTTIAGTSLLARMAGIQIFGTGGLGGVHRGAQHTMDISADLIELSRTPISLFSSGCKSFLDIPRTLEYLETHGVHVSTFRDGQTGQVDFPAFWTRKSGVKSPSVVENEAEAAAVIYANMAIPIEMRSGLLFANPIPEEHSVPPELIDGAIDAAVEEAAEKGFDGHRNTPFILAKIKELTKGISIPANKALVESNVERATKTAVLVEELKKHGGQFQTTIPVSGLGKPSKTSSVDVLVAGSIAVDLSCDFRPLDVNSQETAPSLHTSNSSIMSQTIGGVGHNVATAAHLAGGATVRLCSIVGDDLAGNAVLSSLETRGLDTRGMLVMRNKEDDQHFRTAQYVAINTTTKDLHLAMADMDLMYAFSKSNASPASFSEQLIPILKSSAPKWLIIDANWDTETLHRWINEARKLFPDVKIAFEPVSNEKAMRIFGDDALPTFPNEAVSLATPNIHELDAIFQKCLQSGLRHLSYVDELSKITFPAAIPLPQDVEENANVVLHKILALLPYIPTMITKLGGSGILVTELLHPSSSKFTNPDFKPHILELPASFSSFLGLDKASLYLQYLPVPEGIPQAEIVSVNGVGDTFLGVLVAGLAQGEELGPRLLNAAQKAAALTLKSKESVSPEIGAVSMQDLMK